MAPKAEAQQKVIQLYGVVKASDSTSLPGASVFIKGTRRGTIANDMGIYSIAVSPGDSVEFSFVGFKSASFTVPKELASSQLLNSPLLISDTSFLPTAIVSPLPTPAEFKFLFLNTPIERTNADIARQNLNLKQLLKEMKYMPLDGNPDAIYNLHSREQIQRGSQRGLVPTSGLFNPFAWAEFVKSLKEGGRE